MKQSKLKKFLKLLGPGLITGASDDDPSGIATYSQAGAQFGLATLWTALITFPLMAAIQEICARIGMVTAKGLTEVIAKNYSKPILYFILLFSLPAIILNIGADISAMGAVVNLLFPSIPANVFAGCLTVFMIVLIIYLPYKKFSAILKFLCLSLMLYIILPFATKQPWLSVLKNTFIPTIYFDKKFISILVAILGTTISPYLFFWQATMEAQNKQHKKKQTEANSFSIGNMRVDVRFGMLVSNLVMYFIILSTGTILYNGGIRQIETVEQAAKALEPLAGKFAYLFFATGVIGTGLLAIPVLCGTLAYMLSEAFAWEGDMDRSYHEAKKFYWVIISALVLGFGVNFTGITPVQALIYTAILYGLSAPPIIFVLLHIANNKKIMGKFTNGKWANLFGILTLILMTTSAMLLLYFQFV